MSRKNSNANNKSASEEIHEENGIDHDSSSLGSSPNGVVMMGNTNGNSTGSPTKRGRPPGRISSPSISAPGSAPSVFVWKPTLSPTSPSSPLSSKRKRADDDKRKDEEKQENREHKNEGEGENGVRTSMHTARLSASGKKLKIKFSNTSGPPTSPVGRPRKIGTKKPTTSSVPAPTNNGHKNKKENEKKKRKGEDEEEEEEPEVDESEQEQEEEEEEQAPAPVARRRGRPRKNSLPSPSTTKDKAATSPKTKKKNTPPCKISKKNNNTESPATEKRKQKDSKTSPKTDKLLGAGIPRARKSLPDDSPNENGVENNSDEAEEEEGDPNGVADENSMEWEDLVDESERGQGEEDMQDQEAAQENGYAHNGENGHDGDVE